MHSRLATEALLQKDDVVAFKLMITNEGLPQVSTPIWVRVDPEATMGSRKFKPPPGMPFLPDLAERLPNPKGGKGNTPGWEAWANSGKGFRRPRFDDFDDFDGLKRQRYGEGSFVVGSGYGGNSWGGGSSFGGASSWGNSGSSVGGWSGSQWGGGSSGGAVPSSVGSHFGNSSTVYEQLMRGGNENSSVGWSARSQHSNSNTSGIVTTMQAPSADGSADQKRQWFAHVYQQYVESYKAQGQDDNSARNMAQRSLEQYKQQCVAQGIRLD